MAFLYAALMHSVLLSGGNAVSYNEAYADAQASGQPLVVLIGADWCPGCQTMKNSVMPALKANGSLEQVAYAQVNTDREGALAQKMMSGSSIPQLVMYYETEAGWQRKQITGARSANEISGWINGAVKESAAFVAAKKAKADSETKVAKKVSAPATSQ